MSKRERSSRANSQFAEYFKRSTASVRMSLRVCYILPRLLLGKSDIVVGAAAANCVSLTLELRRRGVNIELLAPVSKESSGFLSRGSVLEVVRPLPNSGVGLVERGVGAIAVLRRGLKDMLRENHFDIIHGHSGTYPYAVVPLAANRETCVRLHSLYCPMGAKGGVYGKWWEMSLVARTIFNRLDRVIAVTENVRRSIEKARVRPEKIELVPMCVDTRRFRPQTQRGPGRYFSNDNADVRLLFIGNASKEKGLLELLQAVRLLNEKGVPVSLVAAVENQCAIKENSVGYDLAQKFLREMNLENRVRFIGLVDSIESLYAESDLVVIPWNTTRGPSDYPMVVLEAMAIGKCVVSTPVGGCPDLLRNGKAGILTDGFSAENIAAAIEYAVKNPGDRRRIEQVALERSRDFSLTNSANDLLTLYKRLLESKIRHHVRCGF